MEPNIRNVIVGVRTEFSQRNSSNVQSMIYDTGLMNTENPGQNDYMVYAILYVKGEQNCG